MKIVKGSRFFALLSLVLVASAASLSSCPGYKAVNVKQTGTSLKADLVLAGAACNVYGNDIPKLALEVDYEDGTFGSFS